MINLKFQILRNMLEIIAESSQVTEKKDKYSYKNFSDIYMFIDVFNSLRNKCMPYNINQTILLVEYNQDITEFNAYDLLECLRILSNYSVELKENKHLFIFLGENGRQEYLEKLKNDIIKDKHLKHVSIKFIQIQEDDLKNLLE
ncbi:MAG: hypothetical protein QXW35_05520 [Candidatus Aenigmatarchaeota archaeon]